MNKILKNGLITASVAILAGHFVACGTESTAPDLTGVTIDPDGIADNSDFLSSSSIPGIESSNSVPSIESSSSMPGIESSSSENPVASSSSRWEPTTPVVGCKTRSIKGAGYGCAGLMGDIEWFAPDYQLSGKDFEGGDWYDFDDSTEGGDSFIEWDIVEDPNSDKNIYQQVIDQHRGLKGEAEVGTAFEYAYAGFGFGVGKAIEGATNKFQPIDASNWNRICLEYTSSASFAIVLVPNDSLAAAAGGNLYKAPVGKTGIAPGYWCTSISEFKQEKNWGTEIPIEEMLQNLSAIEFKFSSSADFNVRGVAIGLK